MKVALGPLVLGAALTGCSTPAPAATEGQTRTPLAFVSAVETPLLAADRGADDDFGAAVALDGDTLVVAAPLDGDADAGALYVFARTASGWSETQRVLASGDSYLGQSLALQGDTLVAGAFASAFVFVRTPSGWVEQAQLVPTGFWLELGQSVALDGDRVLVGGPSVSQPDRAWIFARSGATWTQEAELSASDASDGAFFGQAVGLSGDVAVVGASGAYAPAPDVTNLPPPGAVYVYQRAGSGWSEVAKLDAAPGGDGDAYGFQLALGPDRLLVGAENADQAGHRSGAAWLYERSAATFVESARLLPPGVGASAGFPQSVALGGDLVLGSIEGFGSVGTVAVFRGDPSGFVHDLDLQASDGALYDFFGASLAVSGTTLAVGAPGVDRAYAYQLRGASECSADLGGVVDLEGTLASCAPYLCAAGACRLSCAATADCAPGFLCDPALSKCVSGANATHASASDPAGCALVASQPASGSCWLLLAALCVARRRAPSRGMPARPLASPRGGTPPLQLRPAWGKIRNKHMANALKFHATVSGKTLALPDLTAFEGKRVQVIVVEDDAEIAADSAPSDAVPNHHRQFGTLAGQIVIAEDFDAPLPDDLQRAFDGSAGP